MAAGDKPGIGQMIVGAIMVAAGAILTAIGLGAIGMPLMNFGLMVMAGGALAFAAGLVFKAKEPSEPKYDSATYGFSQFQNRAKGDTSIPVVYSNDTAQDEPGHKVAPIYLSTFVTPRGYEAEDIDRARSSGQAISLLMAVAEGPILGIDDVRINGEPAFAQVDDVALGTANGTKKVFTLSGIKRIDLRSLQVYTGLTPIGYTRSTVQILVTTGAASNTQTLFPIELADNFAGSSLVDDARNLVFKTFSGGQWTTLEGLETDSVRPMAWMDGERTIYVYTQVRVPTGVALYVTVPTLQMSGCVPSHSKEKKELTLTFSTAPANGTQITCSYRRALFPGIRVEMRNGAAHQLPLEGFEAVRNSVTNGQEITSSPGVTFTTDEEADDVILNIASSPNGFTAYDKNDGSRSPVNAQFKVTWKRSDETGSPHVLYDSRGAVRTGKTSSEFECSGDSTAQLFWSFSVKKLLQAWYEEKPNDTVRKAEWAAFRRARFTISVTRNNLVRNATDGLASDRIYLASYTKVTNKYLAYPGTALLAFHGIGSEKLSGSIPNITCRVRGKSDVEYYSSGQWLASETAQANRVWAAVDILTSKRYGGGNFFTKAANIDTTSAFTAAAWLDETVNLASSDTEVRSKLDYVLDTRRAAMDAARDILAPGRIVPVLRGNVWHFVIDKEATLADVPVIYDDGSDGRTAADSLSIAHGAVTDRMNELQIGFLDAADDHDRGEVWVSPPEPTDVRRIERAEAFGITRRTECERYAKFLYAKATNIGIALAWMMMPAGLRLEAGDVVRVVSTRLNLDVYARILKWEIIDSERWIIRCDAVEYVPAVYNQNTGLNVRNQAPSLTTRTTPSVTAPTTTPRASNPSNLARAVGISLRRIK